MVTVPVRRTRPGCKALRRCFLMLSFCADVRLCEGNKPSLLVLGSCYASCREVARPRIHRRRNYSGRLPREGAGIPSEHMHAEVWCRKLRNGLRQLLQSNVMMEMPDCLSAGRHVRNLQMPDFCSRQLSCGCCRRRSVAMHATNGPGPWLHGIPSFELVFEVGCPLLLLGGRCRTFLPGRSFRLPHQRRHNAPSECERKAHATEDGVRQLHNEPHVCSSIL